MSTELTSVDVCASPQRVYSFAQDVSRWPTWLAHYRYVRVLQEVNNERVAEMSARRDWIPVRWKAAQRLDPLTPRIEFEHLSGWTQGMQVAWNFTPIPNGTRVTISHDLSTINVPLVRTRLGRAIVAKFFIAPIAGRTLARMKQLAEASHE